MLQCHFSLDSLFFVQLIDEISQAPSTLSFLDKRFRKKARMERGVAFSSTWETRNLNQVYVQESLGRFLAAEKIIKQNEFFCHFAFFVKMAQRIINRNPSSLP